MRELYSSLPPIPPSRPPRGHTPSPQLLRLHTHHPLVGMNNPYDRKLTFLVTGTQLARMLEGEQGVAKSPPPTPRKGSHPPTWLLRGHTHPHGISEATPTHMAYQRPHPPTWHIRGHTHPHGISEATPTHVATPTHASQRPHPPTWHLRGHTHPHGFS